MLSHHRAFHRKTDHLGSALICSIHHPYLFHSIRLSSSLLSPCSPRRSPNLALAPFLLKPTIYDLGETTPDNELFYSVSVTWQTGREEWINGHLWLHACGSTNKQMCGTSVFMNVSCVVLLSTCMRRRAQKFLKMLLLSEVEFSITFVFILLDFWFQMYISMFKFYWNSRFSTGLCIYKQD